METLAEIEPTAAAVRQYLKERRAGGFVTSLPLKVVPYGTGPDTRIGWERVYIVLVNDLPYGFTDGPLQE
jgi:hypothetical protein